MVPLAEIADPSNDYNLNLPRYIDSSEPEDMHDLDAHLRGGIPNRDIDALGEYWTVFPSLRNALFSDNGRAGYSAARIETREAFSGREIKSLVVEDKWLASIRAAIEAEVQRLTQCRAASVQEIEDRYACPLPELERDVEAFSAKIEGHLSRMGLTS